MAVIRWGRRTSENSGAESPPGNRVLPNFAGMHAIVLAATLLSAAGSLHAGTSNSLLDISADGTLLATANRDNGSVTIVNLKTSEVVHEIPVGHKPEGVSFLGASHTLAA